MPAYKAPLREFRYVLHEVLGAAAHYAALGRDDINAELIEGVLEGAARFAEDVVAPTNEAGDRTGVRRTEDGRVVTPPGFVDAYRQYVGDGWASLCGSVDAGGQGLPEDADIAAIQAESRNGVLKVRVPKTPAPKPRTVEVQVN